MSDDATPNDRPGDDGATTQAYGTPMAVDIEAAPQTRRGLTLFIAGPVVWFGHFMLVYMIAEAGCTGAGPGLRLFDPPVPVVVTLAATAVAAAVCLVLAWWQYRRWQHGRQMVATEPSGEGAGFEGYGPRGTLAFGGFLLALISFASVLFVGLPALVLGC